MAVNGKISCRLDTQSSSGHGSLFGFTVPAPGFSGNTVLENGVVKVFSGSVIEEDCTGSKSFIKVTHRALTAIRVANAQGSVAGVASRSKGRSAHLPVNRFVGKRANRASR
jgi:hypothetical protein